MADGGHIEFYKMLKAPHWTNIPQTSVQTCDTTTLPSCPKTKPEVNLHDVISRTSGINVGCSQQLYDIFKLNLRPPLEKQTGVLKLQVLENASMENVKRQNV